MTESTGYCRTCKARRLVRRDTQNHIFHLLASVFLCGLWFPVWMLLLVLDNPPWRCSVCGETKINE